MSEETKMSEENKKTIIAFIAGLLVGGLLAFIFINPSPSPKVADEPRDVTSDTETVGSEDRNVRDLPTETKETPATSSHSEPVSAADGAVTVPDQAAGAVVKLSDVTFPTNGGWIGVRDYVDGRMTGLLGVARWNKTEALAPQEIKLLRSTVAGHTYAVVFYTDNGDKQFSLANDVQMEGVMETFKAE